ncbi:MAG: hypothetical protein ACE5SW_11705 [Nitrososphaeraceae archaeon]
MASKQQKSISKKQKGDKKGYLEWKGENWNENNKAVAEIEIAINIKYQDMQGNDCAVQGPVVKIPIKIRVPAPP